MNFFAVKYLKNFTITRITFLYVKHYNTFYSFIMHTAAP